MAVPCQLFIHILYIVFIYSLTSFVHLNRYIYPFLEVWISKEFCQRRQTPAHSYDCANAIVCVHSLFNRSISGGLFDDPVFLV